MSALNRMIPNITRAYFGFDCTRAGGAEIVTDDRQREAKTSFEDRSDGESLLDDIKTRKAQYKQSKVNADGE